MAATALIVTREGRLVKHGVSLIRRIANGYSIFKGDFHLNIAAWGCCIHSGGDILGHKLNHRPLRMLKNNNCDFPACQILLVANILVSSHYNLKARPFGRFDQLTI